MLSTNQVVRYLVLIAILVARAAEVTEATWQIETVDPATYSGLGSSLAILPSGRLAMTYNHFDGSNYILQYAIHNGSAWQIQPAIATIGSGPHGPEGFSWTSLAVNPSSHMPAVAYFHTSNRSLMYAESNGASWSIQAVDASGIASHTWHVSLAFVRLPNLPGPLPAISYSRKPSDGIHELWFAYYHPVDRTWEAGCVDGCGLTGHIGTSNSLAVLPSGVPAIAYNQNQGPGALRYAEFTGFDPQGAILWNLCTLESLADGPLNGICMKIRPGFEEHAIGYRRDLTDRLRYGETDGTCSLPSCELAGASSVNGNRFLALFPDDRPAMAFNRFIGGPTTYELKYIERTAAGSGCAGWEEELIEPQGVDPHLMILPCGTPAVSYYNDQSDTLKFAVRTDGTDTDEDAVIDCFDNCPLIPNPGQEDCNTNDVGDKCDIAEGTSQDCNTNSTPDECEPGAPEFLDCNSNGIPDCSDIAGGTSQDCNGNELPDDCDIAEGTSADCNTNGTPDECEAASPPTACQILLPVSRKLHSGVPRDIKIVPTGSACDHATSECRQGGLTELRIGFTEPPGGPGPCPVTISEMRCPACPCTECPWLPYVGPSVMDASIVGNDLVLEFTPGLENARTYRFEIGPSVSTIPGQSIEVRVLKGDVTDDGQVNSADRSVVVGIWTGPGFSTRTDINLDGVTNAADRSIVVGAWTSPQGNCAP